MAVALLPTATSNLSEKRAIQWLQPGYCACVCGGGGVSELQKRKNTLNERK